jgi:hypothetical protein
MCNVYLHEHIAKYMILDKGARRDPVRPHFGMDLVSVKDDLNMYF